MSSRILLSLLASVGLSLLLAGPAASQNRPTLEALKEAVCEKADADGDNYRPKVCDPRCDCIDDVSPPLGAVSSCAETSQGAFSVAATLPGGSCGDRCIDTGFLGIRSCVSGPPVFSGPCGAGETCPAGYACDVVFTNNCLLEADACTDDSDCTGAVLCDSASLMLCTSDLDCPNAGETCTFPGVNLTLFCERPCSVDTDCDVSMVLQFDNVGVANAAAPVDCGVAESGNPVLSPMQINANDALQCLAQVEALIPGGSCDYLCGNGVIDGTEECDDGNTTPGDGCDASCLIEGP